MVLCVADYNCVDLNIHVRDLNPVCITSDISEFARIAEYISTLIYLSTYLPARPHLSLSLPLPQLMHKCVTKTVGCGTSHKYTNIHNFTV